MEKDKRASDTATLFLSGRDIDYQEITLRFVDCIWQVLSIEKAEDVLKRETPEFLFRLVDFMAAHPAWHGSATELLDALGDTQTPANTVTKLLNQYHVTVLADNSIVYSYSRTSSGRVIQLVRNDGSDSYDSSLLAEKKPSQLSPTVMDDNAERGAGVSPATHLACKV